jgi:hypothetical protein
MLIADQDWGVPPIAFADAMLDPSGRLKVARGQNVYDVDFEYGMQPLRWENFLAGTGAVTHRPIEGGVRMDVAANGDVALRQSRPYFRYQPSKGIYASAAVLFGAPTADITRRVGMFDADNGIFFEQDATGLWAVRRANTGAGVIDTRVAQRDWSIDALNGGGRSGRNIDPARIQMAVMDYAWYGAGRARLGFIISGKLLWCHAFDSANAAGQTLPWSRTGNLPCRYELRRNAGSGLVSFWHWGVSVVVEGGFDEQRGFTFPHANAARVAVTSRRPILSSRVRPMAVVDETNTATGGGTNQLSRTGAGWTANQWRGRYLRLTGGTGAGQLVRITGNSSVTLTVDNPLTGSTTPFSPAPDATTQYQIGLVNRGQLVPQQLIVSSDAAAYFELVIGGTLTGPTWQGLSSLGSPASLSEQDTAATAIAGGDRVWAGYTPAGGQGVQEFDLRQLQALSTNILGATPETLSLVATSFSGTANVAATILYTEAMS